MKARASIRVLRVALLLVFVAVLVTVVSALMKPREAMEQITPEAAEQAADADYTLSGQGFAYRVIEDDRELFEIAGGSYRADRDDNVLLDDGVTVSFDRSEGHYDVTSLTGHYNRETLAARLEGEVEVLGPNDLQLFSDWLDLEESGNMLVASNGTRFRTRTALSGRSETFRIDFDDQIAYLAGGVEIEGGLDTARPYELYAKKVEVREAARQVRAQGDVRYEQGESWFTGNRMFLWLAEENDQIRFVRAIWGVDGVHPGSPIASGVGGSDSAVPDSSRRAGEMRFSGLSLASEIDPLSGQPLNFDLRGMRDRPATITMVDERLLERTISAYAVSSTLQDGALRDTRATGNVEIVDIIETAEGPTERRSSANEASAEFDSRGEIVRLALTGTVTMNEQGRRARADRALILNVQGKTQLSGDPVVVETAQGILQAPQMVYDEIQGRVHAQGGVRATLESEASRELFPGGGGSGPMFVESDEAFINESDGDFIFKGAVRAWRGRDLLLADQLRGDEKQGRMSASGDVKTVWQGQLEQGGNADPEVGEASEGPFEIVAEQLTYVGGEAVRYEGKVRAVQLGRTLICDTMHVELDQDNAAQSMDCSGAVRLIDPQLGREVEGERALYDLGRGEIVVFGSPFVLKDPEIGTVRGPSLWYRLDDGSWGRYQEQREAPP